MGHPQGEREVVIQESTSDNDSASKGQVTVMDALERHFSSKSSEKFREENKNQELDNG